MQDQYGQQNRRFEFSGSGWEYFKIWIVNLLLSIITLGIYSAWAKVRRLQYFYRNTRLDGGSFDYHGDPKAILKGRMIAFGLLVAYNTALEFNPILGLVIGLVLAGVMPWLLMRSLQFKLYNSSYRGLRFGFTGDTRGAYRAFLLFPMLAGMTLYLLAPLAHQRIKQYQFDNSRFGSSPFSFGATTGGFYLIYLSSLAVMVGSLLLAFALTVMVGKSLGSGEAGAEGIVNVLMMAGPFIMLVLVIAVLVVSSLFSAYMQNLVWGSTGLGPHRFFSELSARRLLWVRVSNFVGVVLTLGLFTPFAAIRIARLKLEAMGVAVSGDLTGFVADQQQQATAAGEEAAEMFDVDISF
ncbi:MAG: YjgN family protein [Gallionellaceae bacterium]|nr:YjgN family protein [Gallionellaceae bacterium]